MAIRIETEGGVAEVVIDNPPVNALGSAAWRTFADALAALGRRDDVHCVVIRAEGRGFQAGVDVKELAADGSKIVEVNRG
jgi:enoyl-CoA hydratase